MLYKKWCEIHQEILDIEGVTEERIVKGLICDMIHNMPYDELEYMFYIKKIKPEYPLPNELNKINYLVTMEIDVTPQELAIKRELIKQLKNG